MYIKKMNKTYLVLLGIILIAVFFRFYQINDFYYFISDQGWFYLSARDLLNGEIPLVGITSSYTWVHQGALWTYMLAPMLLIFNYDPAGGAYLSAFLGVLAVIMMYVTGATLFDSKKVGLISAAFLAVSPLSIYFSRMPYHTSPIELATLIFIFSIYKYATGKKNHLILAFFMLGILYNLALVTMVFWILTAIVLIKLRKIDLKLFIFSFIAFLIPMIPMIVYDFKLNSGYFQITTFPRLIKVSIFDSSGFNPKTYLEVIKDLLGYNQRLIFISSKFLALILVITSGVYLVFDFINKKARKFDFGVFILGLWVVLCFLVILSSKHASEAYLPMFYPGIILMVSVFLIKLIKKRKSFAPLLFAIIFLIITLNMYKLISIGILPVKDKFITVSDRLETAVDIIKISDGEKYNLEMRGFGKGHEDYIQNYEYLTLALG